MRVLALFLAVQAADALQLTRRAALGTAAVSPFIEDGLIPLAIAGAGLQLGAMLCLVILPRLAPVERSVSAETS